MKAGPKRQKSSLANNVAKHLVRVTQVKSGLRLSKRELVNQVRKVLDSEMRSGQIDIILGRNSLLKKLNARFANKPKPTDVLSFPLQDSLPENRNIPYLGEIYISLDRAKRQAKDFHVRLNQEVLRLVTHGTLHLLGYDHKKTKEAKEMRDKEEEYLNARP